MKETIERVRQLVVKLNWLPPLLARITVGSVFLESGWGKLHDIEKVIGFFTNLGIPFPAMQAHFVASTELVAGAMIFFGLLTRLASLPLIIIMVVAIITAKSSEIITSTDIFGFSEFLYILLLGWLVIAGPGLVALDHLLKKQLRRICL